MPTPKCPRCPNALSQIEIYRWGPNNAWDVKMARQIVADNPRPLRQITREDFEQLPLSIWPERGVAPSKPGEPHPWAPIVEHLPHIPESKLYEPPIFVPCQMATRAGEMLGWRWIMIDGTHRSARRFREGAAWLGVYLLTREESFACWLSGQSLAELLPPMEGARI